MPLLGKSIASAGLIIASGLSLSACATEDYVDKHIATVNDRISALEASGSRTGATIRWSTKASFIRHLPRRHDPCP